MHIKSLVASAMIVMLSAPLALAQPAPKACTHPPCAAAKAPANSSDPSTEPAGADPMSTPADRPGSASSPATTTAPSSQPPTQSSASMPASNLPSGSDPGSPTAPSPMPGSR